MDEGFWIVPSKHECVAYLKINKNTFNIERISTEEDLTNGNLYESFNMLIKLGTLLFKHSILRLYVYMSYTKTGALAFRIVPMSDIDCNDKLKSRFINYSNTIELHNKNINSTDDIETFLHNKFGNNINITYAINFNNGFRMTSKDKFIEQMDKPEYNYVYTEEKLNAEEHIEDAKHIGSIEDTNQNSESTKEVKEEQNNKIDDNKESNSAPYKEVASIISEIMKCYMNEITSLIKSNQTTNENSNIHNDNTANALANKNNAKRLTYEILSDEDRLKAKEIELNNREKILEQKLSDAEVLKNTLHDAIEIASSSIAESISTQAEGVENIIDINRLKDKTKGPTESFIYEMMLKVMHTADVISIPKGVYKALAITLKKNLYIDISYTEYKAIVELRFEPKSSNFMLAVVDYTENDAFTRITVMKPYNSETVSPREMTDYELKYNEWHKKNSFINT